MPFFGVRCSDCGAEVGRDFDEPSEAMIAMWNRRADSGVRRSALEEAARLVCLGCEEGVKRITDPVTGDSFHDHGPPHRGADCEASPIWLAINGLIEGETK
jgi:hypothetical protein